MVSCSWNISNENILECIILLNLSNILLICINYYLFLIDFLFPDSSFTYYFNCNLGIQRYNCKFVDRWLLITNFKFKEAIFQGNTLSTITFLFILGLKREWFLMKGDKFRLTRFFSQNKNELNLFSLYFWLDEDKLVPRSYLDNNTRVGWEKFSQSPQTTSTNSHISTGVKELSKACENDGASGSMNDDNDFSCLNEDEEIDLQGVDFSQAIPSSLIINEELKV